jgi:hypothetical protein
MSNSQETESSRGVGEAFVAFPILMRLPYLSTASEPPAATVTVAASPLVSEPPPAELPPPAAPPAGELAPAVVATVAVEIANESAPEKEISSPSPGPTLPEPVSLAPAALLSPAAQRRQRALERQRRGDDEPPRRSWRTSHAPIIALGFLLALTCTVVLARRNREEPSPAEQARLEPEIQELTIDMGTPSSTAPTSLGGSLSTPPVAEMKGDSAPLAALQATTPPKLPTLLPSPAAQSEAAALPLSGPVNTEERVANRETVAAKAVVDLPPTDQAPALPHYDVNTFPTADLPSEATAPLPPAAGNPAADVPMYPTTSTPSAWR